MISPRLAVWPGDTPPSREVLLDVSKGDNITLSTLHGTVHLGAHADAPSHYGVGPAIHERDLSLYVGRCRVVRVTVGRGQRVGPLDISAERVLIATDTFPNPEHFNEDFAGLSVDLIESLASRGTRLIGIDTPSVDLFASKDLPAHAACLRHDVAILEGLALRGVPEGEYELIALPLRLEGFDASPVRAVLRTLGDAADGRAR